MKHIDTIKKINIIIVLIFAIYTIFSIPTYAIGDVFSDADNFLDKRKFNIKHNR